MPRDTIDWVHNILWQIKDQKGFYLWECNDTTTIYDLEIEDYDCDVENTGLL